MTSNTCVAICIAVSLPGQHVNPAKRLEAPAVRLTSTTRHSRDHLRPKSIARFGIQVMPERHQARLVDPTDHRPDVREMPVRYFAPHTRVHKRTFAHDSLVALDVGYVPRPHESVERGPVRLLPHQLPQHRDQVGAVPVAGETEADHSAGPHRSVEHFEQAAVVVDLVQRRAREHDVKLLPEFGVEDVRSYKSEIRRLELPGGFDHLRRRIEPHDGATRDGRRESERQRAVAAPHIQDALMALKVQLGDQPPAPFLLVGRGFSIALCVEFKAHFAFSPAFHSANSSATSTIPMSRQAPPLFAVQYHGSPLATSIEMNTGAVIK